MESSSICLTSSSSSSSSPSIGMGSNEQNDLISLANEDLRNGDVVHAITLLSTCIESKLFAHKTNNNNNINNFNINSNTNTTTNSNTTNSSNTNTNSNSNYNQKHSKQTNTKSSNDSNETNETSDQNMSNSSAQELSKLYAIRGQSYHKLGLHQLAADDCETGIRLDNHNPDCYYFKGLALLGLKKRESAEQSFRMALELRQNYSEASTALVQMRYDALKEAGFDEETANRFAPKSRSVDEAIDHILSTSLTSDQLSNLRASYTRSLTTNTNQFSTQGLGMDSQYSSSMSGIFRDNKNLNNIRGTDPVNKRGDDTSESLGLKLISDIDNCLGSILDSDEEKPKLFEEKMDNNMTHMSATNANDISANNDNNSNSNNNFCDIIGDNNLLISSRSLSPQMSNIFGVSSDLQLKAQTKANNFSIDLNKDSLGSHIIPKTVNIFSANGPHNSTSGEPSVRKTFADIASANTKKPIQTMKPMAKSTTSAKIAEKIESKDIFSNRSQKSFDSTNKVSSLESFSAPNCNSDGLEKIEKMGQLVLSTSEPTRPTNLMAYKGLWVCNISPETSYITLKKVFRKFGNFTGIQTFERKATNGSNIVFVHYDNNQSPTDAIAELFGIYRKDICFDEITPLKLRFTPSMEQTKSGDLPSMEKAKRVVEKSGECFNWRLSTGCHKGERCQFKHFLINKSIDSQPWVKALKKKANET